MQPQDLIDRLTDECPLLKFVGGAADFAAAEKGLRKTPAAFVVPLTENAHPNSSATMVVRQQVTQQFGVIIAISNLRDARGEKALGDLHQVRTQVMEKLLGWTPPSEQSLMEFGGGCLLDMNDQVLWWQDEFLIDIQLRSK